MEAASEAIAEPIKATKAKAATTSKAAAAIFKSSETVTAASIETKSKHFVYPHGFTLFFIFFIIFFIVLLYFLNYLADHPQLDNPNMNQLKYKHTYK